jgi:hypothetical protein
VRWMGRTEEGCASDSERSCMMLLNLRSDSVVDTRGGDGMEADGGRKIVDSFVHGAELAAVSGGLVVTWLLMVTSSTTIVSGGSPRRPVGSGARSLVATRAVEGERPRASNTVLATPRARRNNEGLAGEGNCERRDTTNPLEERER